MSEQKGLDRCRSGIGLVGDVRLCPVSKVARLDARSDNPAKCKNPSRTLGRFRRAIPKLQENLCTVRSLPFFRRLKIE